MILGIDEAGRGPWAGPMVVGAVVLGDVVIEGLNDSKQLTKKRREVLEVEVLEKAAATGLGWVSAREIDALGLGSALRLATVRAVKAVDATKTFYDEVIIDGTVNFLAETSKEVYVQTIAKADGLVPAVSAASIIAKVARDRFMAEQDIVYPGYGFSGHAGYGTAKHRAAIDTLGVTPLHRLSFGPLKKYATSLDREDAADGRGASVTAKQLGDMAERVVSRYLEAAGHVILERNWKTRFCEIDIVSQLNEKTYFTEVKYRKSALYGDGIAAVTEKKLQQMQFAAELYLAQGGNNTLGKGVVQLAVAAVSRHGEVEAWLPLD